MTHTHDGDAAGELQESSSAAAEEAAAEGGEGRARTHSSIVEMCAKSLPFAHAGRSSGATVPPETPPTGKVYRGFMAGSIECTSCGR